MSNSHQLEGPKAPSDGARKRNKMIGTATCLLLALGAAPLLTAGPAQAAISPCDVVAQRPVDTGRLDSQGRKLINYPIKVGCLFGPVTVEMTQQLLERDENSLNRMGTYDISRSFNEHGTKKVRSEHALVSTEPGAEEVLHQVTYSVSMFGVTLPGEYTSKSPQATIQD